MQYPPRASRRPHIKLPHQEWTMMRLALPIVAVGLLAPATGATLEQEYVADVSEAEIERPDGWTHTIGLGAAIQLGGSNKVPGQPDGPTVTLVLSLGYVGDLWRGNNELRLTAGINESVTRTPVVDDFVKASDLFEAEALYYYHLGSAPWLGPFLRASGRTSLFAGVDVRAEEVDYLRDNEIIASDRLRVTDPLAPTYLKQSAGLFARPHNEEALTIDFRLGAGARETLADGSYVVDDDDATPEIEVNALQSYVQAGGEFATDLHGTVDGGEIGYGASFEMMIPFYDSIEEELDPIAATNYEIGANFNARLTEWASVTYDLGLLRVPQIVAEWQITNQLMLSFNYGFSRGVGTE